jgi:hypothetical protein
MTQRGCRWGRVSFFVLVGWLLVSLLYLLGVPAYALERLVPYDDFNATHIDPDKWFGVQPGGPGTEAIRQLQDNRLRLVSRSYGKTDSDSGRLPSELLLIVLNSAGVTAIKATVEVTDVAATGCPGNPEATVAVAGLIGLFFNTATRTPGSRLNEVQAGIRIVRASDSSEPPDVLRAQSFVLHCVEERSCSHLDPRTKLHFQDLGPVKRGEMTRLRVQWDRENHRFIFQRGDDPEVFAPYTVSDTASGDVHKTLIVVHSVANCTTTPRPVAFMDASFDDVWVNESAAPRLAR